MNDPTPNNVPTNKPTFRLNLGSYPKRSANNSDHQESRIDFEPIELYCGPRTLLYAMFLVTGWIVLVRFSKKRLGK